MLTVPKLLPFFSVIALTGLFFAHTAEAAKLTVKRDAEEETLSIVVDGEIRDADVHRLSDMLSKKKANDSVHLSVNSLGGEVSAAMSMGRLLRKHDAKIGAGDACYSSCVLLFAGAVRRDWKSPNSSEDLFAKRPVRTSIGIHRFFYSSLDPGKSVAEITRHRNEVKAQVAEYLRDMNVSPRLLELMEEVRPERIRLLTAPELERYGLGKIDVALEEKLIASDAAGYGVTSLEMRTIAETCGIGKSSPQRKPGEPLRGLTDDELFYGFDTQCARKKFPHFGLKK